MLFVSSQVISFRSYAADTFYHFQSTLTLTHLEQQATLKKKEGHP